MNHRWNTFADQSGSYATARPHYPPALYRWLAEQTPRHEQAWDCATGNGQAAIGLSEYFECVHATDISSEQIAHAMPRSNVEYGIRSAEDSGFPDGCFDLIAVAQALHWFDFPRFWLEVSRVGRHGALFCAWGYAWMETPPEVERKLVEPFEAIVGPFWASNNRLLWNSYRDEEIGFPYEPLETPSFVLELEWTLDQLVAYMTTWSAFKRSRANAEAKVSMDRLLDETRSLVAPDVKLEIRMPLEVLAGRIDARRA